VLGDDARARGVHFLLGPGVNIYRAPMNDATSNILAKILFLRRGPRSLTSMAFSREGFARRSSISLGITRSNDRHKVDSIIDERTLREIYLPSFEAAVKEAHVCSIMDSYNLTNGEHMTQNGYLNNEVVKKEWGFKGIIMSDWTSTYDGVAAVNGGLDLEMPFGKVMNRATLLPAVKAGKVSEATIDDHVRRILRTAIQMGWLIAVRVKFLFPLQSRRPRRRTRGCARQHRTAQERKQSSPAG